jgi:hypothetical protein
MPAGGPCRYDPPVPVAAIADARSTLLRAVDELEQAEAALDGVLERVDLVVVYSAGRDVPGDPEALHEYAGWSCTSGPKWVHAALLRRAAEAFDAGAVAVDDEDDDDDDGEP